MVETSVTVTIIITETSSTTKPKGITKLPALIQSIIFTCKGPYVLTSISKINDATIESAISIEATIPVKSIFGRAANKATNSELARGANRAI